MALANQGMLGNLGGQLGPVRSPQVQHSTFQALSSGTTFSLSAGLPLRMTEVSVSVYSASTGRVCARVDLCVYVCVCKHGWIYMYLYLNL